MTRVAFCPQSRQHSQPLPWRVSRTLWYFLRFSLVLLSKVLCASAPWRVAVGRMDFWKLTLTNKIRIAVSGDVFHWICPPLANPTSQPTSNHASLLPGPRESSLCCLGWPPTSQLKPAVKLGPLYLAPANDLTPSAGLSFAGGTVPKTRAPQWRVDTGPHGSVVTPLLQALHTPWALQPHPLKQAAFVTTSSNNGQ